MQHAVLAVLFAGIAFPLIGVFILSLNLIPLRFAMMHVAFSGVRWGSFLKVDPLFLGLLFCSRCLACAGPCFREDEDGTGNPVRISHDPDPRHCLHPFLQGNIHVVQAFSILWGSILSLTSWDLVLVIFVSLLILGLVVLFFKEIQAILYDREVALAVGLPERKLYYVMVFILGLTIAVSMRMIGALLIDAFVLLPAIAANLVSRSLKQVFFFSSPFGLISGMGGLYLALLLDLPTSSTIILVASLIIGCCIIYERGGLVSCERQCRNELGCTWGVALFLICGILVFLFSLVRYWPRRSSWLRPRWQGPWRGPAGRKRCGCSPRMD